MFFSIVTNESETETETANVSDNDEEGQKKDRPQAIEVSRDWLAHALELAKSNDIR